MNRRGFIAGLFGATAAVPIAVLFASADDKHAGDKQTGGSVDKIEKSEAQWREILSEDEFHVLREAGTERPFSSDLNDEKRAGTFVCAGCALPLFKSEWKYKSGTGWPSFWDHIDGHLNTSKDYKLLVPRTEYHCARCGGHQGHLFKDGPKPTGERWCNNGVALNFEPAERA